jgi:hypothetical protein
VFRTVDGLDRYSRGGRLGELVDQLETAIGSVSGSADPGWLEQVRERWNQLEYV